MELRLVTEQTGFLQTPGCGANMKHRAFCLAWHRLVGPRLVAKYTVWDETARALLYRLVDREEIKTAEQAHEVAWRALALFAYCDNGK